MCVTFGCNDNKRISNIPILIQCEIINLPYIINPSIHHFPRNRDVACRRISKQKNSFNFFLYFLSYHPLNCYSIIYGMDILSFIKLSTFWHQGTHGVVNPLYTLKKKMMWNGWLWHDYPFFSIFIVLIFMCLLLFKDKLWEFISNETCAIQYLTLPFANSSFVA